MQLHGLDAQKERDEKIDDLILTVNIVSDVTDAYQKLAAALESIQEILNPNHHTEYERWDREIGNYRGSYKEKGRPFRRAGTVSRGLSSSSQFYGHAAAAPFTGYNDIQTPETTRNDPETSFEYETQFFEPYFVGPVYPNRAGPSSSHGSGRGHFPY
uniref:Uncharacterized protein n=1 Tax=Biomphalaria glabrata TaxID=6526 RepID=A0A2C9L3P4_BIOGL